MRNVVPLSICFSLGMLLLAGCGEPPKAAQTDAAPKTDDKKKDDQPPLLGGSDAEAAADVMVKNTAPTRRKAAYEQEAKAPSGSLQGVCFMTAAGEYKVATPTPLEFTGENAIADAKPGEVDYYKNIRLKQVQWVQFDGRTKKYPVTGAVLKFLDVKSGKRAPLIRTGFAVLKGFMDEVGAMGGKLGMSIGPVDDLVQIGTWDTFHCRVAISKPGGEQLYEGEASAYDDAALKSGSWGVPAAKMISSTPLREVGVYNLRCKRHPWQRGYLHVVDNPYAMIVHEANRFLMPDIPLGKFKVEVWHPVLEPEQKIIEVEIQKDAVTEIVVLFKQPK